MPTFNHLHVHTQYSLLDGAASIKGLFKKAAADNMRAIAITDHGNMFGAFNFVKEAAEHKTADGHPIKPIVGCEFYLVENRHKRQFSREDKDIRYHQLLLAKNKQGYQNLIKLCSLGYIEGMYGKYPRIDKELILQYHEGLIATTCCLGAEVPKAIMRKGEKEAEIVFKWWLDLFGDDYYIELQRHGIPDQDKVNEVLLKFALKYNVPIIASNDSHYIEKEDANAHDILLCINTGEKQSTPTNKDFADDEVIPRGTRFAFANDEFYFKTTTEMSRIFSDLPQALDNTNAIVDKIDHLKLTQDILLPNFPVPKEFQIHADDVLNQWEYLRHLTFAGARERYVEITAEVEERLNFELHTIKTMGFAGYFLIVSDFILAGKNMGVFIGPGRGSAAGSAVAYCVGITNIDPIKYQLLFERFLNPERKSMPDIDTDFDDEGRQKVIDYVVDKYGKSQVAQIITFGTMAAKMSIKDVARVLDLPLSEANSLAKLVPDKPGITLNRVMQAPLVGEKSLTDKEQLRPEDLETVKQLRLIANGNDMRAKVLKEAQILEGSVRSTGIHAAGIIIAPMDLTEIIPVATSKESDLLVTQFAGDIIESAGVIKMDFLGLKNLTILRDALVMIKKNHGVEIDIENIPIDDKKTFELYQKGETNGTFQFESPGMQKHLINLKPDKMEDLIAMNALYRPGPLKYIPNFIARKHGKEAIHYDLPEMEEYLHDTYGITVYQEQVMLLSQSLAGFSKGEADGLRKAMGKKLRAVLDKMKGQFIDGAVAKGHDPKICEKIWSDWEDFAQYAFNKSHSTCYAYVAYRTAYLKANYPAEYMASVLTHNQNNMDKLIFFMDEAKRMGIPVLGPDVNESGVNFAVNKKGQIRFGLVGIKGVGESAVEGLISEREKNGAYLSFFDFVARVNLRTVSKKTIENLAIAGCFDGFPNVHRAQFFYVQPGTDGNLIEKAVKYGQTKQQSATSNQVSLFDLGSSNGGFAITEPPLPICEPMSQLEQLMKEREVLGVFITGHPLDRFKLEIAAFCNGDVGMIENAEYLDREFVCPLIVTTALDRVSKNGNQFKIITCQDVSNTGSFSLFSEEYLKFGMFCLPDQMLYVRGRNQKHPYNDKVNFKISEMGLLSTLREKRAKGVKVYMPVSHITHELIDAVFALIKTFPGSSSLNLMIVDDATDNGTVLDCYSKGLKVDLSDELIAGLKLYFGKVELC